MALVIALTLSPAFLSIPQKPQHPHMLRYMAHASHSIQYIVLSIGMFDMPQTMRRPDISVLHGEMRRTLYEATCINKRDVNSNLWEDFGNLSTYPHSARADKNLIEQL